MLSKKNVALLLGHATFIGLLVLSIEHYLLRCIHVDSAYQIFKWIQLDGIHIEAYRYTAILPQLLVKFLMMLGASLNGLLMAASVSHVIIAYGVFLVCAYVFRSAEAAFASALAAVLCNRLAFYGMVLEANYLLSFPFLFFGYVLSRSKESSLNWVIMVPLLLVSMLVHPIGAVVMALGTITLWAHQRIESPATIGVVFLCIIWVFAGRWIFPPSEYESGVYADLLASFAELSSFQDWSSVQFLADHTFHLTWSYLPALLVSTAYLIYLATKQKWVQAGGFIIAILAFTMLNICTFYEGDTAVMMGKNFVPLGTLIALPIALEVMLMNGKKGWLFIGLLAAVMFTKFRDISFASRGFNERLDALNLVVESANEASHSKCLIGVDEPILNRIGVSWALPYETILLSSIQNPRSAVTTVVEYSEMSEVDGVALQPLFNNYPADELNNRYFVLQKGAYQRLRVH